MARTRSRARFRAQLVKKMVSNATKIVLAEGPYSRTDAKTKASETEILALIDGSLMLNDPVSSVSPASTNHSDGGGWSNRS